MSDITETLKSVPKVELKIIQLTWELIGEDGRIDMLKASFRTTEVNSALDEAEAYAHSVSRAILNLKNLRC